MRIESHACQERKAKSVSRCCEKTGMSDRGRRGTNHMSEVTKTSMADFSTGVG